MITSAEILFDQQVLVLSSLSPRVSIVSSVTGLFQIQADGNVEFRNVDLFGGTGTPGAGNTFDNFGILKLNDVQVFKNPSAVPGSYLIKNHSSAQLFSVGQVMLQTE